MGYVFRFILGINGKQNENYYSVMGYDVMFVCDYGKEYGNYYTTMEWKRKWKLL